jgi:hypothetical protein
MVAVASEWRRMGTCALAELDPFPAAAPGEFAGAELPCVVKSARFTSSHSLVIVVAPPQSTGGFWAALTITNPYIATRTTRPVAVAEASERTDSRRRAENRTNAIPVLNLRCPRERRFA